MIHEFSALKLVDIALSNARAAGHEPSHRMIATFWKIASGRASDQDVIQLKAEMSLRAHEDNVFPFVEVRTQLAALEAELKHLQQAMHGVVLQKFTS